MYEKNGLCGGKYNNTEKPVRWTTGVQVKDDDGTDQDGSRKGKYSGPVYKTEMADGMVVRNERKYIRKTVR